MIETALLPWTGCGHRPVLSRACCRDGAADALAAGAVVGHGFATMYALTSRPDERVVRRTNALKGRPESQVGSVTVPSRRSAEVFDLDQLPEGLTRATVLAVLEALLQLGPFGFRGPAAAHVPGHLTAEQDGVRTVQLIGPGRGCPSEAFLERALAAGGLDLLHITSANRSHHRTGAADAPAHWKAAGLLAEFAGAEELVVLEHDDEDAARRRLPGHLPESTSVLSFHRTVRVPGARRPALVLERHGSLVAGVVGSVLDRLGLGLVVAPTAADRLRPRDYRQGLCDR